MTDQDLKKLSRAELLEMLIEQSELCDELQRKLDQAMAALQNREIIMSHAGTMAEAAMRLTGVFEAADRAAALYLENMQRMDREIEDIRAQRFAAVQRKAGQILNETVQANDEIPHSLDLGNTTELQHLQQETND